MIRSMSVVLSPVSLLVSPAFTASVKTSLSHAPIPGGPSFSGVPGMPGMDDMDLASFLKPEDKDYIHVPIRALSATTVQGGIIDFSYKNGLALKAAVGMFNQLTVFKDHNLSVDGWLGKTSGAYWDTETLDVPPGVNMTLNVDTKADPKVARGLLSGALDSGSVTIKFNYEQSHPEMDQDEFFWKMGEVVDGQVVRALVTEIVRCMEYSVVWQGADVYAKVIGEDGKIITPGMASNSLSLQRSQEKIMDWKQLALLLGLSLGDNVTKESFEAAVKSHNLNTTALAEAQTALVTAQTERDTAQTALTAATTQAAELTTSVTKTTADLAASQTQVTALNTKVAELTPLAAVGTEFLTNTRSEALRLYNLVEGDKATEAMRSLITNAALPVAQSFVSSYKDRAEQVAPMKCVNCGSANLSRGTAQQNNDMPGLDKKTPTTAETESLRSAIASIHGK